ncbi:hypothetical protein BDK51DRAFT_10652, partial [Blyttiomyces helicus]
MSPPPSSDRKESGTARFLGAASSGVLELLGFHPVDTVAKRLMNNQKKAGEGVTTLNEVLFRHAANRGTLSKYVSLFPGLGFAAGYKIMQRVYKFGGQPYVMDYFSKHHKKDFADVFGDKNAKTIMHATAGRWVSGGE